MPKTKEQYEEIRMEKRKLIYETALWLFASKGYVATSISDIAKHANISKGLLYNYFKSKEELLQIIMDNLVNEYGNMIDPNHDGVVTPAEAENFIDKFFDMIVRRREEFKLYYQLSFQPQVVSFLAGHYNSGKAVAHQQLITQYFSKKLDMDDPQAAYFTTVSFIKGAVMVAIYADQMFPDSFLMQYKEVMKKFFL
jgi:AcrR family transcriptional regulator